MILRVALVALTLQGCCAARHLKEGQVLPVSANPLNQKLCPWSKGSPSKVDMEIGFWVGRCGVLQRCDKGHHIVEFILGTYGKPSDACTGPTGLINLCEEKNRGSAFGYIQGVCSNGKRLATFQVAGATPVASVSSAQGFNSVNGTDVGTCCTLGAFMGTGITHIKSVPQSCPENQVVSGYMVGVEPKFDFAARELVEGTVAEFTYLGFTCS